MAGIYIHIPFCKKACHYCNFHFSTSLGQKEQMVKAIIQELHDQKAYLETESITSIYFGGGTPSILTTLELQSIIGTCHKLYSIEPDIELTLEANPDDLSLEKTKELSTLGINRLSIGIQSFHEEDIQWMNRSHNANQSFQSIENSYASGIENFSIDLIFGSPTTSNERWVNNLELAHSFNIKHLSCYSLTVEEGTALSHHIRNNKCQPVDDVRVAEQYELTMDQLSQYAYDHYEISNYALPGYQAYHNTNYWKRISYLGIGPSAHSFNGSERSWNIANNSQYINLINDATSIRTTEVLNEDDHYNEYIMTGLRTHWGCSLSNAILKNPKYKSHFLQEVQSFIQSGDIIHNGDNYILNKSSWVISDSIISELFI